jgi:hypothetical protein
MFDIQQKNLDIKYLVVSGIGSSYHNRTSDVQLEGWDAGLRASSKYVGVAPGTEFWTIDVVKWFISDVLKVEWQPYRAF